MELELTCGDQEHLCLEGCIDVSDDADNCGACGVDCATEIANSSLDPLPGDPICYDAGCVGVSECYTHQTAGNKTCDDVCGAMSMGCAGPVWFLDSCTSPYEFFADPSSCDVQIREFLGDDWSAGCACVL